MKERNCYVYEDYRMDNWTCCYVGMGSKNEENGYNRLEIAKRNDYHDRIMSKYGIVRTIIRDNLTREEANTLEEARIYYYVFVLGYTIDIKGYRKGERKDSHLTNQTWGGDGIKGFNPFENKSEEEMREIAKKKSEAKKGEKNPNYGRHLSEETKKKMREAWSNKTEEEIEEWKKKISEANQGEKSSFYGKHHSEETKKKMSEVMKGHEVSEETRKKISEKVSGEKHPMARKVRCIETGKIFNTLTEAGKWCGLKSVGNIIKQIKGKRNYTGKHPITEERLHWEYVIE